MSEGTDCERCGNGEIESKITLSADYEGAMESTFRICLDCVESLGEWYENPPEEDN